jgi:hypothetical protein
VRVARKHAHRLDPLSGDLELQHFVGLDILYVSPYLLGVVILGAPKAPARDQLATTGKVEPD